MSFPVLQGRVGWGSGRDKDGYRTHDVTWQIKTPTVHTGPAAIYFTPGLPVVGATWTDAMQGLDVDDWCFCWPECTIKVAPQQKENEPGVLWHLTQTFTNRPLSRCQDFQIDDPLNEPPDISGSFVKYTREATEDMDGNPIRTSSHEIIKGKAVERDDNRPTVSIAMNTLDNQLGSFALMIDTVNDGSLWGLGPRMIKLSNVTWRRKLYGSCTFYYTTTYDFDINYKTFDRYLLDVGTKVLIAGGDPTDPRDFVAYKDKYGENARVALNGAGVAVGAGENPYRFLVKFYEESNFLLLGIPTSL